RHEANVAQHDHFVVTGNLFEGAGQVLLGVLPIAGEPLLVGTHDAGGCIQQPLAARIVPGPADEGTDRPLGFGAGGTVGRPLQRTGNEAGASWVLSYKRIHTDPHVFLAPPFRNAVRSASAIGCKWGEKVPGADPSLLCAIAREPFAPTAHPM